jgi:hypothetical protein
MKTTRLLSLFEIALFGAGLFSLSSCSKNNGYAGAGPEADQIRSTRQMFQRIADKLPSIGFYDEKTDQVLVLNPRKREFSFASPNPGWNFSNNTGVTYVTDGSTGIIFVPFSSIGGNTGGTVVAGNTTLNINYAFCFSASQEALGLDLFDFGGDFTGVSAVFGIAGNFSALESGNFDEVELDDLFQGMAMYIVYSNEAQGSYQILNWLDSIEEESNSLSNKGFSWVIDFVDFNMYLSNSGDLNVSGGEMDFTGDYLGFLELFEDIEDEGDLNFAIVPGFGAMGCE